MPRARELILSSDFTNPGAYPWFPASEPERLRLLGKVLREAKDTEVWSFTTPQEVAREFEQLRPHLGRRRAFWEYLLGVWRELGLL